jgi:hypothetical protein
MTKIILDSRSYDLGDTFNFGGIVDIFPAIARKNTNTFTSDYEKKENTAQKAIDKLVDNFTSR